jgi:signal transduction histidine kinase
MTTASAQPPRWYRSWTWQPDSVAAPGGPGPATYAITRLAGVVAAALRGGIAVVGAAAALIGMAPPASPAWVVPAATVSCLWAALFARRAVTRGLSTALVLGDAALTCVLALIQARVTARDALPAGAGWVEVLITVTVVLAQFAWRPLAGVTAGLVVTACYLAGASRAALPDHGLIQGAIFVVQIGSAAALMWLIRRAAADADAALAEHERAGRDAEIARLRRGQEREHNRRLHDTVLATLTMVGTAAISRTSPTLRRRAAADLAVIDGFAVQEYGARPVRLDERLREAADALSGELTVEMDLPRPDGTVPAAVADAFTAASGQALVNVVRHAGTGHARLALRVEGDAVIVEVTDHGRGFDPMAVPPHRYGLREAIGARMRAVGGRAEISSRPGRGTRIRLVWARG